MRKKIMAAAVASTLAFGGAVAPAAPAHAQGISTNFISPNNGDVLHNTGINPGSLPAPIKNVYDQGMLDELLVGTGIALGALVAVAYAATSFNNLQIGDGWLKPILRGWGL